MPVTKRLVGNYRVKAVFARDHVPEEFTSLRKNDFFLVLAARAGLFTDMPQGVTYGWY